MVARRLCTSLAVLSLVTGAGCGTGSPRFTAKERPDLSTPPASHQLQGIASYYADEFDGRKTASGETYDMHELTAAHRTLPFNTRLKVLNLENRKSVVVRITDRGPFKDDRIIDLSYGAARVVGMIANGTAPVILEILELADPGK